MDTTLKTTQAIGELNKVRTSLNHKIFIKVKEFFRECDDAFISVDE